MSVTLLLAGYLGQIETINELERAFAAGEITNRAIADASAASYAGRTTSEVTSVLAAASWIDGIEETLCTLTQAGTLVLLATITWRFAAEFLQKRHGLAAVSGTELPIADGVVAGHVSRYLTNRTSCGSSRSGAWSMASRLLTSPLSATPVRISRSFAEPAARSPSMPHRTHGTRPPEASTPTTCATSYRSSPANSARSKRS